ncbi:MAG: S46 family peptidase [Phycisphaerae bacterium]|nr:S46 family peptidase [Phycisphaerae bacterium]
MPAVELELLSPAPISALYERFLVEDWLVRMVELLGADHELVRLALGGKRPNERAAELVNGSGLADPAYRKDLFSGGGWIVAKSSEPMIALAKALDPHLRRLQRQIEDTVDGPEADGYSKIASARFAVHGEQGYPDATFTLRLAYGPIRGYEQDGRTVPAYTDFAGLYTRAAERAGQEFFDLPKRWTDRKPQLDLSTPFNFVCTADIIGGNSGSPVLNKAGEVIGLIFDGNIQSLVWDYAYSDAQGRAVCVDARAIIHALRAVYEAKPLVDEILAARETNK